MSKKNEIIEGQLYFDMDLLPSKQVVQANKLEFCGEEMWHERIRKMYGW